MKLYSKFLAVLMSMVMFVTAFAIYPANIADVSAVSGSNCDHYLIGEWIRTETTHTYIYPCCNEAVINNYPHIWDENNVCTECGYSCKHNFVGGCNENGVCEYCGLVSEESGNGHTGELVYTATETTHSAAYDCCGEVVVTDEAHKFYGDTCVFCKYICEHDMEDGVCTKCEFTCDHEGGEANCLSGAICTKCGNEYTDKDADNHGCDIEWVTTRTKHYSVYGCNGEKVTLAEKHYGGTADCTTAAICEVCGVEYGEKNADVHAGEAEWTQTATEHTKTYTCCGADEVATEAHEWENGVCTECKYGCEHTGGEATCTNKAVCTICGSEYGELKAHDYSEATCTKKATCNACGAETGELKPHDYSEATCTKKATCNVCGAETGELKPHDYSEATCTELAKCKVCGATTGSLKPHDYTEATCTELAKCKACGATTGELKAHDYSEATCTEKATCKACGATTGELKAHNYKDGTCVDCSAKDPNYNPDTSDRTISVALMIAAMAFLGYAIVPSKKRHTA